MMTRYYNNIISMRSNTSTRYSPVIYFNMPLKPAIGFSCISQIETITVQVKVYIYGIIVMICETNKKKLYKHTVPIRIRTHTFPLRLRDSVAKRWRCTAGRDPSYWELNKYKKFGLICIFVLE